MEQSDLLRYVVERLERLGLRYFVTGSVVTVFYGEPRFTHDIDVVVALTPAQAKKLCREFPPPEPMAHAKPRCLRMCFASTLSISVCRGTGCMSPVFGLM